MSALPVAAFAAYIVGALGAFHGFVANKGRKAVCEKGNDSPVTQTCFCVVLALIWPALQILDWSYTRAKTMQEDADA